MTGRTPFQLQSACSTSAAWGALSEALAKGPSKEIFALDDELQAVASAGVEAILAGPAAALPEAVDFSRHRRLLDVGGGTGSWSIAVARAYPHLAATIVELPTVAEIARRRIAEAGLASRVVVVTGDAMTGALPPGHDAFLLANLAHYWSPEQIAPCCGGFGTPPNPARPSCWPTSGPIRRTPSRSTLP